MNTQVQIGYKYLFPFYTISGSFAQLHRPLQKLCCSHLVFEISSTFLFPSELNTTVCGCKTHQNDTRMRENVAGTRDSLLCLSVDDRHAGIMADPGQLLPVLRKRGAVHPAAWNTQQHRLHLDFSTEHKGWKAVIGTSRWFTCARPEGRGVQSQFLSDRTFCQQLFPIQSSGLESILRHRQ